MFSDNQLLRYSRQIMEPRFDLVGQQRLAKSKVLVIGAGGLGSPALIYLASAGVGVIKICDDDCVELSNLQRQVVHYTENISMNKAVSAKNTLLKLNPEIEVIALEKRLDETALYSEIASVDLVLDCTDNFSSRLQINKLCKQLQKNLVLAAATRFEGQIIVFDFASNKSPCYQCLYPDITAQTELDMSCSDTGIIAPITGILGAMQALEAIKWLAKTGECLLNTLMLFDGFSMEWHRLKLNKNDSCLLCGRR